MNKKPSPALANVRGRVLHYLGHDGGGKARGGRAGAVSVGNDAMRALGPLCMKIVRFASNSSGLLSLRFKCTRTVRHAVGCQFPVSMSVDAWTVSLIYGTVLEMP